MRKFWRLILRLVHTAKGTHLEVIGAKGDNKCECGLKGQKLTNLCKFSSFILTFFYIVNDHANLSIAHKQILMEKTFIKLK